MSTTPEATQLELDRVSRCYGAVVSGCIIRHLALPVTTLRVRRGEWVGVAGRGPGPLTLLRCAAGLVPPDTGRVRWLDDAGREVSPPRVTMIHADWAPYSGWSARDALWAATSPRAPVVRAGRHVERALRCAGLHAVADRRVAGLPALDRWRVGVAAALAGGAEWLLLELPPIGSPLGPRRRARAASPAAEAPEASEAPDDASLASLRRMGRILAASGVGALVASTGAVPFALHRRLSVPGGGSARAGDAGGGDDGGGGEGSSAPAGAVARVAEPGEGAWERPGIGVASPPWQV